MKIRTLGFFQPFGTLMLHDKIETRWVREGRKPPFPLGKYLFYTTQNSCDSVTLFNWCGAQIMQNVTKTISEDKSRALNGYAIATGDLYKIRRLKKSDEEKAFVKFIGRKVEVINGEEIAKIQWGLYFKNIKRIEPFRWKFGKQGVGFVPDLEENKIKVATYLSK